MRIFFLTMLNVILLSAAMIASAAAAIDDAARTPEEIAQSQADLMTLYKDGRYEEVVAYAETHGDTYSLVLAARALNAIAYFEDDKEARRTSKRALKFSKAALEIDPSQPEAFLQAALSMAIRSATISPAKALITRAPGKARRYIDDALTLDQENPWALSASGAWRMEVARHGGGAVFGADVEEGHADFVKARRLQPENVVIAYECALRFLASGREEWRPAGLEALVIATEGAPQSHFESGIQERARALQRAVENGARAEKAFIKAQR